jgi:phosphate transport system protein
MSRPALDSALAQAERGTEELEHLVVGTVRRAMTALRTQDRTLAERVIIHDAVIDARRYAIEEETVGTIATQEPVAQDLRLLVSILNVIVDLERIADHAEGIARIVLRLDEPVLEVPADLWLIAEIAISMVEGAMAAFHARDVEEAGRVADRDDEVDELMEGVAGDLIESIRRHPSSAAGATYLIWVAHDLERIADRATNICERVVYLATGETREVNVSRRGRRRSGG